MSKMDNQRAMREAKYARTQARAKAQPAGGAARPAVAPAMAPRAATTSPTAPSVDEVPAVTTEALCGHRSMNGRTCTRESGHAAKSHRYS